METHHKKILLNLRPSIVNDLDVSNIINKLLSEEIVTTSFYEELDSLSREQKTQKLLDHIPRCGPNAYSIFKDSMRSQYSWISEAMDKLERTQDCVDASDVPIGNHSPHSHLPANPPLSIDRAQKTLQLRKGLKDLKPGQYLALHALQGYGKSSLASATLKDKNFVAETFMNEIYWIKFGQQQSTQENILIQLNLLFHLVKNLDLLAEPTSEDSLKYSLKKHFSQHDYALIVLDDVNSQDIINAFDFRCKTLVLTTDIDILRGKENHVITMSDGFSTSESLDLFSKATGIPVPELPSQARQIHEECKGMPLMIAMFSAQFEDIKQSLANGQSSHEIWSYYLDTLRKKRSSEFYEPLERRSTTFDLCINRLTAKDKYYYETLAIFPEDVNITTKTLSIFWGVEFAEVDPRMSRFCKKALVCREWHECFKSYIYGVHSLVLNHLRDTLDAEYLTSLHRSYVEKNFAFCHGDFSKLPEDNYIHSYIGYHMEKGGLTNAFPTVYLNFSFIESKILHIGPGDLLIDLKKYRIYVTQGSDLYTELVEDLEKFLVQQASTLAEYRRRFCLDLVQVALKHPFPGFVKSTAEMLAKQRKTSLYLNHLKHYTEYGNSYSEELHHQVRSVAFTNQADVILVGNDNGKIISWNCNDRNHVTFYGNDSQFPITKIVAPENARFFVSISEDGKAKIFEYPEDFNERKSEYVKTLHPRAKQPEWKNLSESRSNQDDSKATLLIPAQRIVDIAVCRDAKKIAACTDSGCIAMWDTDGRVLISPQSVVATGLASIAFSMCDTLLHTVNTSQGTIVTFDAEKISYITQFGFHPDTDKILSLISARRYSNLLVIVMKTKLHKATWSVDGDHHRRPQTIEFARLQDRNTFYTCVTVTKDGKYVITADTGGSVNVFTLDGQCNVVKTFKNLVYSLDTHYLDDKGFHIVCAGNRDTLVPMVHRWKFVPTEKPEVQRLSLFDAKLEPVERSVIAVATSNKTVQIIQNDEVIAETPVSQAEITSLRLSPDGDYVVYATKNGCVSIFDLKLNQSDVIMELSNSVKFITILNIDNDNVVVCDDGDHDLKIWKNVNDTILVEDTGAVIECNLLSSVNRVITVSETGAKIWDQNNWKLQSKYQSNHVPNISSCSLSTKQNFIAFANTGGFLHCAKIVPRLDIRSIKFQDGVDMKFDNAITACAFSSDEMFLAAAFKTGDISIINHKTKSVLQQLELHRLPVKKLYWSPFNFAGSQVLVSLTNELAFWLVSPPQQKKKATESHRDLSQSLSSLMPDHSTVEIRSSSTKMRTSRSLELGSTQLMQSYSESPSSKTSSNSRLDSSAEELLEKQPGDGELDESDAYFWMNKKPKYHKIAGLLSVVKLDGDLATRVRISNKFDNFITINGEGVIYNLNILKTEDRDYGNGDS